MKEKIVVLDFGSGFAHLITKYLRNLGYYTEIALPNIDISEFENVKGIIFADSNDSKQNKKNPEFNKEINSLNIPKLKISDTETLHEDKIILNFLELCKMKKNWNSKTILNYVLEQIQIEAENKNVLLLLSGGVVSTVAFALLNKALGQDRVLGLHIDNGFMRKDESKFVARRYINYGFSNFILEDASNIFLDAIKNTIDPQEKRNIIDETFLEIHNNVVKKQNLLERQWILAQGTLYPKTIETGRIKNSHVTKINHNKVVGIQSLISKGLIIEPLRDLYKEEVRLVGKELNIPEELVMRHPFSRAGLAINTLCSNDVLSSQEERELRKANQKIEQLDLSDFFRKDTVNLKILPIKTIGVQNDFKTYKFPVALYVNSKKIPDWDTLEKVSTHITDSVEDVNRIIYCIYEKENCVLQEQFCTKQRLDQVREVDEIVISELKENNWYSKIFKHLTINLPYSTSKEKCSIVLNPIILENDMLASFAKIPTKILNKIIEKISKLDFVDALYFDITNKTPTTFTWE